MFIQLMLNLFLVFSSHLMDVIIPNETMSKIFVSKYIVLENFIFDGGIAVDNNGKIVKLLQRDELNHIASNIQVLDYDNFYLMPGIIDTHVHLNEPGRTQWEGFETGTKAAAVGGITTIFDMPLNSIPPTTTVNNLKQKVEAAKRKTYVNVGFWGGLIPGNQDELLPMMEAGVIGFKGFLCPSGVDEFPGISLSDMDKAYEKVQDTNAVLLFHAEEEHFRNSNETQIQGSPFEYQTYLNSRPDQLELDAIEHIITTMKKYKKVKTHIVHLSTSKALNLIKEAKLQGLNLTVETCHHYLNLNSEEIPNKRTEFKCAPPIRNLQNQKLLWEGLNSGIIDMVVSDHSPSTPDLKFLTDLDDANFGNFMKAWGGISSVQFGLSLMWTQFKQRGISIFELTKLMSQNTAKLVGLDNLKGRIDVGYDADFVIWDPNASFQIETNMIQHKNKITPYLGKTLYGKVIATIIGGEIVYEYENGLKSPRGKLLISL